MKATQAAQAAQAAQIPVPARVTCGGYVGCTGLRVWSPRRSGAEPVEATRIRVPANPIGGNEIVCDDNSGMIRLRSDDPPCPDCDADAELYDDNGEPRLRISHDASCPTMAQRVKDDNYTDARVFTVISDDTERTE